MSSHFTVESSLALLTKHAKQDVLSPIFTSHFDASIVVTDKTDTDTLGTFDNAVARTLRPDEAALKKAYLACQHTGLNQGLGSEGSFNSMMGLGVVDEEILAFVDIKRNIEVIASAKQLIGLDAINANDEADLEATLAPFVEKYADKQRWLLQDDDAWIKGLRPNDILQKVKKWPVRLDPDFRAMNCPARQEIIALAAKDLVKRLSHLCPQCNSVDFVAKHDPNNLKYLACELCSLPTTRLAPPVTSCDHCGFVEEVSEAGNTASTASAMYCTFCNP